MARILTVAALFTICGILLAGGNALAQEERNEVTVLIPLQYMHGSIAAQIFGGMVIPPAGQFGTSGRQGFGGQTGYGGGYDNRSGSQFGNQGMTNRTQNQRGTSSGGDYGAGGWR